MADNPDQKIELKMFHAEIVNDHAAIKAEEEQYVPLPKIREVSQEEIAENYNKIRADIQELITREMEKLTPVAGSKQNLPTKSVTGEMAKSESCGRPKIFNQLKKSKKPQKKSLSL